MVRVIKNVNSRNMEIIKSMNQLHIIAGYGNGRIIIHLHWPCVSWLMQHAPGTRSRRVVRPRSPLAESPILLEKRNRNRVSARGPRDAPMPAHGSARSSGDMPGINHSKIVDPELFKGPVKAHFCSTEADIEPLRNVLQGTVLEKSQ